MPFLTPRKGDESKRGTSQRTRRDAVLVEDSPSSKKTILPKLQLNVDSSKVHADILVAYLTDNEI